MTNESPFSVLVTSGNQALLGNALTVPDLAVGQLGVFDYDTGLSMSAAQAANLKGRRFFLAVGVDRDGDAVVDDVIMSSGGVITPSLVSSITAQCYTASAPKIVDITGFTAKCDTEYCIKVELENAASRLDVGHQSPYATFVVKTSCCTDDCETCPTGDCSELGGLIVDAINNDPAALLTATYIDYTTTPGTPIVVAAEDVADWYADEANADLCLGVRITTNNLAIKNYCNINLLYEKPRETNVNVSLGCGFECNGTSTVFQELVFEQGSGYDIKNLEYQAGGWNGVPGRYRASAILGISLSGFESLVTSSGQYVQCWINYGKASNSAWLDYKSELATLVVIPCDDSTTRDAFADLLLAIVGRDDYYGAGNGASNFNTILKGCDTCA